MSRTCLKILSLLPWREGARGRGSNWSKMLPGFPALIFTPSLTLPHQGGGKYFDSGAHQYRWLLVSALLLTLAGCAGVATRPGTVIGPDGAPLPAGDGASADSVPLPAVSDNRAVIALVGRARLDAGAGQREAAGASLERALRIEPRNAWLWHELAQVRHAQGQYAQAIALARKSISFAGGDKRLLAFNWRVIGNARAAQGDPAGAEEALKRAAELDTNP